MSGIDWAIAVAIILILNVAAIFCRKYMKGVADFLVAGRKVGKFLGTTSGELAVGLGVITILATLQAAFEGGLVYWYVGIGGGGITLMLHLSGFGYYRLRETRIMTINELLERRYSRKLRIFCGMMCFLSGIINTGIFPIVGSRFFVYFCGLPLTFSVLGHSFPTIHLVSGILLSIAVLLCLVSGQISILLTDFVQGCLVMVVFIIVGFATYRIITVDQVMGAYLSHPEGSNLISPFSGGGNPFNIWFLLMNMGLGMYGFLCWAPSQTTRQSAKDAQEARYMLLLNYLRMGMGYALLLFVPAACWAAMHLPAFTGLADSIRESLATIINKNVQSQLTVPIFMAKIFPVGIMGLMTAAMLSAFISTNDSYIHCWSGILVQDIILPIRKKPLKPKQHMLLLRLSIIFVAIFIYIFSIFFRQTDYLFMFMAMTGAIYMAGAGSIILGALYWRRATTIGAWAAMITGSTLAVSGILIRQIWPDFPLHGLHLAALNCGISLTVYILVSLLTPDEHFDLEALLHRPPRKEKDAVKKANKLRNKFFATPLSIGLWIFALVHTVVVIIVAWYNFTYAVNLESWVVFYKYFLLIFFFWSIPVTLIFIIFGTRDLIQLLRGIEKEQVDVADDGQVHQVH